jgi:hypothetical protein
MNLTRRLCCSLVLTPLLAVAAPACKVNDMTAPLALTLRPEQPGSADALDLVLELRNCSSNPVAVLFDTRAQPPVPTLRRANGAAVAFRDKRRVAKFDRTIEPEDFVEVAAGASLTQTLAVDADDEGYTLTLGPFVATRVAPGRYVLTVAWESRLAPGQGRAAPRLAWTGQLHTEPYELTLRAVR